MALYPQPERVFATNYEQALWNPSYLPTLSRELKGVYNHSTICDVLPLSRGIVWAGRPAFERRTPLGKSDPYNYGSRINFRSSEITRRGRHIEKGVFIAT